MKVLSESTGPFRRLEEDSLRKGCVAEEESRAGGSWSRPRAGQEETGCVSLGLEGRAALEAEDGS